MNKDEWKLWSIFWICFAVVAIAIACLIYSHEIHKIDKMIEGGYEQVQEPSSYNVIWKKAEGEN